MSYTNNMYRIKSIHFIGIGGAGMNGIAEVLLNQGYKVTGSDKSNSAVLQRLSSLGIETFCGHDAKNVAGADAVVVSTAISSDNSELVAAKSMRIPVIPRAEMLAELMRFKHGIAISGTHGKTTTTSLVATILGEGGLDPTFVIGGLLNSAGCNAKLGVSNYFIAEADESDASFLYLYPTIAVVTNIDADHMGTYDDDFDKLKKTFVDFIHHLPFYGLAVLCIEDPIVREIIPKIARPIITYGFNDEADVRAVQYQQRGFKSCFKVCRKGKDGMLDVEMNLPGRHNVLNALSAIAVATECGISDDAICLALDKFKGVGRRMQVHDELSMPCGKVLVIDDYGHHPREIEVTIDAIRAAWPGKRVVLAFQPHRYSRLRSLFEEFAASLSLADELVLLDVYSAGEVPLPGISGQSLCQRIQERGKLIPKFVKTVDDLPNAVLEVLRDGDILLLQGAGNIGSVSQKLKTIYK